jgi:5,10-methenyltetrahydromethanopterin hydrogenase
MVIKTLVANLMKEKSIPGYNQAANIDRNACLETARRFHFGTEGIIIPAVNSFMEKSDDLKTVNL